MLIVKVMKNNISIDFVFHVIKGEIMINYSSKRIFKSDSSPITSGDVKDMLDISKAVQENFNSMRGKQFHDFKFRTN